MCHYRRRRSDTRQGRKGDYRYKPSPELAKELQNYVKSSTAPYKYPRIVEFVEELPKTISGKIKRKEIRDNDAAKNN